MKVEEVTALTKKGDNITIRECAKEDADNLIKAVKNYLADNSPYLTMTMDEFHFTREDEEKWIQTLNDSKNSLHLVVLKDDVIIGNIHLTGSPRKKMEHTAEIGMGIEKAHRNDGIGSLLLRTAIKWARQSNILEKIWLEVFSENKTAISLYEKFGFINNGTIVDFFKQDGKYFDKVTMSLEIN